MVQTKKRMTVWMIIGFLVLAGVAHAQGFELYDDDHLDIDTAYPERGYLHDNSTAKLLSGGSVDGITTRDYSSLTMKGGSLTSATRIRNSSSATVYGGTISSRFRIYEDATGDVYGGDIERVYAEGGSANVYGGTVERLYSRTSDGNDGVMHVYGVDGVDRLYINDNAQMYLHGYDFEAAGGATLAPIPDEPGQYLVFGEGTISGKWFDGTPWSMNIHAYDEADGASLFAVPEPSTLAVLAFGALYLRKRNR